MQWGSSFTTVFRLMYWEFFSSKWLLRVNLIIIQKEDFRGDVLKLKKPSCVFVFEFLQQKNLQAEKLS